MTTDSTYCYLLQLSAQQLADRIASMVYFALFYIVLCVFDCFFLVVGLQAQQLQEQGHAEGGCTWRGRAGGRARPGQHVQGCVQRSFPSLLPLQAQSSAPQLRDLHCLHSSSG